MSPEQAGGEESSTSSDLFSAGVIAAEFFLPGRLFDGKGKDEILARLRDHDAENLPAGRFPDGISGILRKSLSREREDRYPDAGSFSMAIARAVPETASRADLVTFWDRLFPEGGREEDDTVVLEARPAPGGARMVREKREPYGIMGLRGVRISVTSALVAASVGGVMLWKGTGPSKREKSSVVAEETSRVGTFGVRDGEEVKDPGAGAPPAPEIAIPTRTDPPPGDRRKPIRDAPVAGNEGRVWIETDPAGVSVDHEDGTSLGSTPFRLDTALIARGKVYFRKEGYVTKSVSAGALGQLPRFRIALERRTGTVEVIQAIPWAKVYEGDRYLGITPISSLTLPVGEHRLRFVNEPLRVDRVESVFVAPGTNPKLIVPLVGNR